MLNIWSPLFLVLWIFFSPWHKLFEIEHVDNIQTLHVFLNYQIFQTSWCPCPGCTMRLVKDLCPHFCVDSQFYSSFAAEVNWQTCASVQPNIFKGLKVSIKFQHMQINSKHINHKSLKWALMLCLHFVGAAYKVFKSLVRGIVISLIIRFH